MRAKNNECVVVFAEIQNKHRYEKKGADFFAAHSAIFDELTKILNAVQDFPVESWRVDFIKKLNEAFDVGYAVKADLLDGILGYLGHEDIDEVREILDKYNVTLYEKIYDDVLEELLGVPSSGSGVDPILLRPLEELAFDVNLLEKLSEGNIHLVGDLIQVTQDALVMLCDISEHEMLIIKESLASRGLTLGMKIS
jgi:hypothetical protein